MDDQTIIKRETVTEDSLAPRETIKTTSVQSGTPHSDEEAGGALAGAVGGAAIGAVVGGPVGAVVGGAIGGASGATAGAVDEKAKDATVVTQEERRS
jgi:uncharacterized protein YcfJ